MTGNIGLIAEDATDIETLSVLVRRVRQAHGKPRRGIKGRHRSGCGVIPRKAASWMRQLAHKGYTNIIVVHDLDLDRGTRLNDEEKLRELLAATEKPPNVRRLVCIPIEEIEAWFWSDPAILNHISRGTKPISSPHLIRRPKEKLQALSRNAGGKPRLSESSNPGLAKKLNLPLCRKLCPAFDRLSEFVLGVK